MADHDAIKNFIREMPERFSVAGAVIDRWAARGIINHLVSFGTQPDTMGFSPKEICGEAMVAASRPGGLLPAFMGSPVGFRPAIAIGLSNAQTGISSNLDQAAQGQFS